MQILGEFQDAFKRLFTFPIGIGWIGAAVFMYKQAN